jgi:transcriptional regulator with XRE-family HTH domain
MEDQKKNRFYSETGKKIQLFRHQRDISQEALGRAVGLTRTSISNVEKGRQKLLIHSLFDIAEALSVEVAQLLPDKTSLNSVSQEVTNILAKLPEQERQFIEAAIGIKEKESQ